jgi:large subunit ribosomal protein L21
MFAVIETGGKQYIVEKGSTLSIEKLPTQKEKNIRFEKVLLIADGDKVSIGNPYIEGGVVGAEFLKDVKGKKKVVFRYHSKTRYRKLKGHRQPHTNIRVLSI